MYFTESRVEVGKIYDKIKVLTKWDDDPRSKKKMGWGSSWSFPWFSLWNFCDDIGVAYEKVYHRDDTGKVFSAEYFFTTDDANEIVSEYMEQWNKNVPIWKEEQNTINMWALGIELGIGKGYNALMDIGEAMRSVGVRVQGRSVKKLVSRDDIPAIAAAVEEIRARQTKMKAENLAAVAAAQKSNRERHEQWEQRQAESRRYDDVREELDRLYVEKAATNSLLSQSMTASFTAWYAGEPDGTWVQSKWDDANKAFGQWQVDIKGHRKELQDTFDAYQARIAALEQYKKDGTVPDGGIESEEEEVVLLKEVRMPIPPQEQTLAATDVPAVSVASKTAVKAGYAAVGPWSRRGNKWWPQSSGLNGLNIWERGNSSGLVRVPVRPGQDLAGIVVACGAVPVTLSMRRPTLAVAGISAQQLQEIV